MICIGGAMLEPRSYRCKNLSLKTKSRTHRAFMKMGEEVRVITELATITQKASVSPETIAGMMQADTSVEDVPEAEASAGVEEGVVGYMIEKASDGSVRTCEFSMTRILVAAKESLRHNCANYVKIHD
mmetsp:Transcript_29843/g.72779  ORF Transcript_29843/g.72779 Transcript_29843/m.72779 type:complete len:128 (-) Transcript_29843:23-406(-)